MNSVRYVEFHAITRRDGGRGFISDGAQGKAIIFDLKSLKVIGQANAAPDADCILYDPASKHVFTFNGDSHSATAIDPETGKNAGTIDLGGGLEFAVADGQGMIYNNLEDKSEVLASQGRSALTSSGWLSGKHVPQLILWLAVRHFGNVRGDPFQNELADQICHRIRARARQTIEHD